MTGKEIVKIIDKGYLYPTEVLIAKELFDKGVTSEQVRNLNIEDTKRINVSYALRNIEREIV